MPFKHYVIVMAAFVTVYICSNLIGPAKAAKPFGFTFGAGELFFPISCIYGDILTDIRRRSATGAFSPSANRADRRGRWRSPTCRAPSAGRRRASAGCARAKRAGGGFRLLTSRQAAIEKEMAGYNREKEQLKAWLAAPGAYSETMKDELKAKVARQGEVTWQLERIVT